MSFSAGQLGLTHAIRLHDGIRPIRTFAQHRIRGAMLDALRERFGRWSKGQRKVNARLVDDWKPLEDRLAVLPAEPGDAWERLVAGLSRAEKLMLALMYKAGFNQAAAAKVIGCHQANVSILHRKALRFIREKLSESDLGYPKGRGRYLMEIAHE